MKKLNIEDEKRLETLFGKKRRYYKRVLGFYVRVPRWYFEGV